MLNEVGTMEWLTEGSWNGALPGGWDWLLTSGYIPGHCFHLAEYLGLCPQCEAGNLLD